MVCITSFIYLSTWGVLSTTLRVFNLSISLCACVVFYFLHSSHNILIKNIFSPITWHCYVRRFGMLCYSFPFFIWEHEGLWIEFPVWTYSHEGQTEKTCFSLSFTWISTDNCFSIFFFKFLVVCITDFSIMQNLHPSHWLWVVALPQCCPAQNWFMKYFFPHFWLLDSWRWKAKPAQGPFPLWCQDHVLRYQFTCLLFTFPS